MGSEFREYVTGGDGVITIELSWPDKRLSPNSRCHWREKAKAATEARSYAYTEGVLIDKRLGILSGDYQANYIFHPPDKRRRDIDNCLSMMKAAQDGVCQAYNIDDSHIKRTVLEWGEVVKGGKVVLRLEEMK